MKKQIMQYADRFPDATVIDSNSSLVINIKKVTKTFELTIPSEINEIFFKIYDGNSEIFTDWSDYYMGDIEQRRNEKKKDIFKVIEIAGHSEDFRVAKAKRPLEVDQLECLVFGQWSRFNQHVWPEPNTRR